MTTTPRNNVLRFIVILAAGLFLSGSGCSNSDQQTASQEKSPASRSTQAGDRPPPPEAATPAKLDGSFQVRNRKHELLLRPREASSADGTPIVLYSKHPWKCLSWRFEPGPQTSYRLINYYTSKSFQPSGSPTGAVTPVVQTAVGTEPAIEQCWQFIRLDQRFYRIVHAVSGRVLTAGKDGSGGGPDVFLAPWDESDTQQWELLNLPEKLTG